MVTEHVVITPPQVLYRSSSAHMLLFIQIGVEMWDFDLSGENYVFRIFVTYCMCVCVSIYMYNV